MEQNYEVVKISDKIKTKEILELINNQLPELVSRDFSYMPIMALNHNLAPKKDIVTRYKTLTLQKKYSKISFKKYFLENK